MYVGPKYFQAIILCIGFNSDTESPLTYMNYLTQIVSITCQKFSPLYLRVRSTEFLQQYLSRALSVYGI